jgi:DNA-binding transcriptional LysR family regulator
VLGQPSDLDLRLIRVFLAVVDAGGVTPAQATLNVGQSTISTQLSTLETRLGYRLCERGRSGFRLTARGEQFVDSARKLLTALDAFSAEARKVGRTLVGTLNLGLIGHAPVNANARISQAIERFRQRDESVHFTVSVRPPGELEGLLLDGKIHMAIGYFWHRVPALEYTTVFHETQLAYAGRGHPLFSNVGNVSPEEALTHAWAWRSYPLPEAAGSPAERLVTAVADNMEAVAMLVLSGRHLGYLPEHFAAPYVAQGLLAPLAPAAMRYDVPFDMVVRRDARRNDLLAAFIADMKAAHA